SGQMQLPFVLQSAETMKSAVAYLEPHMEKIIGADGKVESSAKAKLLIATVRGDVHDIGKNLVDIILTNNGYEVINLGIKQSVEAIIDAQQIHQADCIAMSGLLVKSTAFMKDNLAAFNDADINVPVILGGAALTPRFVNKDCRDVYHGQVIYGRDAFTDLRFMDALVAAKKAEQWDNKSGFLGIAPEGFGVEVVSLPAESKLDPTETPDPTDPNLIDLVVSSDRSDAVPEEVFIEPPFWGTRVLLEEELPIDHIFAYLDKQALFAGQWQLRKNQKQSRPEYELMLQEKAEPVLTEWMQRICEEKLLSPRVIYGYFPCGRKANSVVVFDPFNSVKCLGKFELPRQKSGNRYCIADFYRDLENEKPTDVIPMQAVTMGPTATAFAKQLFEDNKYTDYLYFHGLGVQLAEALAELVHARIRKEMGFENVEPKTLKDVLAQRYRGSRYSFGYPACPNVADSRPQLDWLGADRIGLTMDESDQLDPEQSTTALVALHSQARYFSA
uniref:vitamin B12 dependent-methionine synthase activation domain-containing protein n=1 Tax=Synechococcus sp. UW140 TaxID=368503 RepID=UPI0025DEB03F